MVMDRHGKLILAGLPGLDLRAPYSGGWCCGTVGHGKNRESIGILGPPGLGCLL